MNRDNGDFFKFFDCSLISDSGDFLLYFIVAETSDHDPIVAKIATSMIGFISKQSLKGAVADLNGNTVTAIKFAGDHLPSSSVVVSTIKESLRESLRAFHQKLHMPVFDSFTKSRLVVSLDHKKYGEVAGTFTKRLQEVTEQGKRIADNSAANKFPDAFAKFSNKQTDTFFIVEGDGAKTIGRRLSEQFKLTPMEKSGLQKKIDTVTGHDNAYAMNHKTFVKITDDTFQLLLRDPKSMEAFFDDYKAIIAHEASHAKYELGEFGANEAQKVVDLSSHLGSQYMKRASFGQLNVTDNIISETANRIERRLQDEVLMRNITPREGNMLKDIQGFLSKEKEKLRTPYDELTSTEQLSRLGFRSRSGEQSASKQSFWSEYDDIVLKTDTRMGSGPAYSANHFNAAAIKNMTLDLIKDGKYTLEEASTLMKKISDKEISQKVREYTPYEPSFADMIKKDILQEAREAEFNRRTILENPVFSLNQSNEVINPSVSSSLMRQP